MLLTLSLCSLAAQSSTIEAPLDHRRSIRLGDVAVFAGSEAGQAGLYALQSGADVAVRIALLEGILASTASIGSVNWQGLYVSADAGLGLYSSDGTQAGTGSLLSPAVAAAIGPVASVAVAGDRLYLVTEKADSTYALRLYQSFDQVPVELVDGFSGVPPAYVARGSELAFIGDQAATGRELWFSDGTVAGTRLPRELNPGPEDSVVFLAEGDLAASEEYVWFRGATPLVGEELHQSDGTAAGTILVADMSPGPESSTPRTLQPYTGGLIFGTFTGEAPGTYVYDPAAGPPVRLDAVGSARAVIPTSVLDGPPSRVLVSGFLPGVPVDGDLWSTDGTEAGTVLLYEDFAPILFTGPAAQVASDGTYLLKGNLSLVKTDGTPEGTELIDSDKTNVFGIVPFGDRVLFSNSNGIVEGTALNWISLADLGASSLAPIGVACAGAPELRGTGLPTLGTSLSIELQDGRPGQLGALMLSDRLAPAPSIGTCSLGLLLPKTIAFTGLDGTGSATVPVGVPAAPQLVGLAFELQYAGLQLGGPILSLLETSNVLEAVIGE